MNLPPRGPEEGFEGLFETILLLRKMERPAASLREYNNLGCSEYIFLCIFLRGAMGYTVFGTASYIYTYIYIYIYPIPRYNMMYTLKRYTL